MGSEHKCLWAHVNEECCIINELRPRLEGKNIPADIPTDASWEQVLTAADRVAAEAITAIKEDRKGAGIPRLVNCVWHCLNHLKNPRLRDIERRRPQVPPDAASPDESDQKISGKRVTFRDFMITFKDIVKKTSPLKKGPSIQETDQDSGRSNFMDDDEVSIAAGFIASVEKVSRLSEAIEMLVQEFVRADIDTSAREDAFREMFLAMGEMADTLKQVVAGKKISEELCSTDLMEQIATEFRSSSMHTFSLF